MEYVREKEVWEEESKEGGKWEEGREQWRVQEEEV